MHLYVLKNVKLIYRGCLPILMFLYIMLAYLMLFIALFSAISLCNAYFLPLTLANAFCFHTLSWIIDTVSLFFSSCTVL